MSPRDEQPGHDEREHGHEGWPAQVWILHGNHGADETDRAEADHRPMPQPHEHDPIVGSIMNAIVPIPRSEIAIRVATAEDLPFLDSLQKQYNKALGFFPRAQMEGYIRNGWVLVAQEAASGRRLGYCASRDRYLKRD